MGTRAAAKKTVKAKGKAAGGADSKKPVAVQQIREQIVRLVAARMETMTNAMAGEAEKGCLSQYKYLLEVIGVHPMSADGSAEKTDSDDLAQVLLNSFEFPKRLPKNEEDAENAESTAPAGVGSDSVE
jgi:hypothetical protein